MSDRSQERLRQAGVYAGRVDGIWGADSQGALGLRLRELSAISSTCYADSAFVDP